MDLDSPLHRCDRLLLATTGAARATRGSPATSLPGPAYPGAPVSLRLWPVERISGLIPDIGCLYAFLCLLYVECNLRKQIKQRMSSQLCKVLSQKPCRLPAMDGTDATINHLTQAVRDTAVLFLHS